MRTPLCEIDAKREDLCPDCQKRLDEGKINDLDVRVSRSLHKLSKKFFFKNVDFTRALELNEIIVLVCEGNIGSLIGKRGRVVAELTAEFGKKCRVIERSSDEKKMVQDLVGTARVLGINKVFDPEKTIHRIIIAEQDKGKMIAPREHLEKGISELLQGEATIEFE
ncbi:MAG: hypothetical protein ABID38_05170 [Candidatus Diapherotrites archaeon]